jgi:NAD(P)-dependent dehydrogenase (short-subunit alcohol dehydrogenase family)
MQAPEGRPATADAMAEASVFVATDRASVIDGATFAVNGGRTAM